MDIAGKIVVLIAAVMLFSAIADRIGVPAPLLLVTVGVVASLVPGAPEYRLEPELVLVGILPPLLYAAAIRTSLIDIRRDKRAIGLLSVGLVAFSCITVGFVTHWLVPDLPLAAGFALGAVVAPPDAVATTAIARRVGLPRRVVSILEGESLVNDAIALVALRTSVAAIVGSITAWRIGMEVAVATVGGIVVGLAVATALVLVRRRVEDVVVDTTLSFLAPFIAFIAAEEISIDGAHPSGVLAVVITGVVLGHRSTDVQSASARLAERINWRTVQFVLENAVFLLIGLQIRSVIEDASDTGLAIGRLVLICGGVLVTAIVVRVVWVFPATYLPRRLVSAIERADPSPPWQVPMVISWAGMRGVVTLAAVFTLPAATPQRSVLVLAAFVVVAGTLLVHGSTLPALVRRLGIQGPDPADDALTEAAVLQDASSAGLARLDELAADGALPDDVIDRLRARSLDRANRAWERLGPVSDKELPSEAYRRVRIEMLAAERAAVRRQREAGLIDEDVVREVQHVLDVEESLLDRDEVTIDTSEGAPLRARTGDLCRHLEHPWPMTDAPTEPACEPCRAEGMEWVHLRMCQNCGLVGCCDSSPGQHAEAHFRTTGHPVMRSVEPGEEWRWCYVDDLLG